MIKLVNVFYQILLDTFRAYHSFLACYGAAQLYIFAHILIFDINPPLADAKMLSESVFKNGVHLGLLLFIGLHSIRCAYRFLKGRWSRCGIATNACQTAEQELQIRELKPTT